MLINSLFLAISSSVDSLGIGITYGIKNTRLTIKSKLILFATSFIISIISIYFGNVLKYLFSDFITAYLGSIILIAMGVFICFQSLRKQKKEPLGSYVDTLEINDTRQIYSFFINFLGITIQIIKNPISSDLDKSNSIDSKEALFLGFALSLDCFCIGIGFSFINSFSVLFPLFISCFQLFFLSIGNYFGKKLYKLSRLPDNIWSILSGILLVLIGILKLFC